jgi:hypothetical protein
VQFSGITTVYPILTFQDSCCIDSDHNLKHVFDQDEEKE